MISQFSTCLQGAEDIGAALSKSQATSNIADKILCIMNDKAGYKEALKTAVK